jgi:transcriptional regulator with XRE-family HTH domain
LSLEDAIRKELGDVMAYFHITQQEVAERIGVRRDAIRGYLRGSRKKGFPLEFLVAVSELSGVPVSVIVARAEGRDEGFPVDAEARRAKVRAEAKLRDRERKYKSRLGAVKHRTPWTEEQMQLILREDLSVDEIARLTGRTYVAVVNQRRKAREEQALLNMLSSRVG